MDRFGQQEDKLSYKDDWTSVLMLIEIVLDLICAWHLFDLPTFVTRFALINFVFPFLVLGFHFLGFI